MSPQGACPIIHRLLIASMLAAVLSSSCAPAVPVEDHRLPSTDAVLNLYRNSHFQPLVLEFYTRLTDDRAVAVAILEVCDALALPPSLAFALAWNESQFDPKAINHNATSVDRGLFQLNSKTFSRLSSKTVYDPAENAKLGLGYYKSILDKLGTPEKALGYYNAGIGMLTDRVLPRRTLAYIDRILADQQNMDRDAIAWLYFSHEPRVALR